MDKLFIIISMLIMVLATDSEYSVIETVSVYGIRNRSNKDDKNTVI